MNFKLHENFKITSGYIQTSRNKIYKNFYFHFMLIQYIFRSISSYYNIYYSDTCLITCGFRIRRENILENKRSKIQGKIFFLLFIANYNILDDNPFRHKSQKHNSFVIRKMSNMKENYFSIYWTNKKFFDF